jgi:hypothetical protein
MPTPLPATPQNDTSFAAYEKAQSFPQSEPNSPNVPTTQNTNPLSSAVISNNSGVVTASDSNPLSIVDSVASQPAPTPPSMTAILNESNIPQMQSNVAALQQQYTALQTEFNNYSLSLNGNGVPQGIVDVETDATAKAMQVQLNNLQAAMTSASTNLTNAQNWTQLQMQAQGTDYQTAVTAYNTAFSNALSVQNVLNTQANINQQNAAAYLSSLSGLITSGSLDPAQLPASMKASIASAELQAGWPVGTIENFTQAKPGANIVGSVNSVDASGNQVTTLIHQNADGSYGMTNITMPGSPVSLFGVLPNSGSSGSSDTSWIPSGFTAGTSTSELSNNNPGGIQAEGGVVPAWATSIDPNATVGTNGQVQFSTGALGVAAIQENLSKNYGNLTLSAALQKWTGNTGYGATSSTVANLLSQFGLDPNGKVSDVLGNATEGPKLVNAIMQGEGSIAPGTSSTSSSGGNNLIQSWVQNIQNGNATISQVPAGLKNAVSQALASTPQTSYSPLASSRFTTAANRIVSNYIQLPAYQLVAGGQVYLARIAAAEQNPGSISDQDLLDSLTQLNKGGGQISDAQVSLITNGQSYSDWASVLGNKLSTGGVLSDYQRQQIQTIASQVYSNYLKLYQPIYQQATSQLQAAGIPQAFWTIPNLNSLGAAGGQGSTGATESVQQQAATAGYDYSAMITAGYTDAQIQAAIGSSQ